MSRQELPKTYQFQSSEPRIYKMWAPGSDHIGIATQLMVERHLPKTEEVL
ncbi:MAG TPA: hypothetical protein VFZ43_11500 [Anaerolineales bacterium]